MRSREEEHFERHAGYPPEDQQQEDRHEEDQENPN